MGVQFWYLLAGAFVLSSGLIGLLNPTLLQLEKKTRNQTLTSKFSNQ
jgi:hypothetical protein